MSWTSMLKAIAVVTADPRLGPAGDRTVVTDADAGVIRDLVRGQLAAFRAGDGPRALDACSPALRESVGTGRALIDLVAAIYPPLTEPASVGFGELELTPDGLGQPVTLTDADGETHHAVLLVEEHEGAWKIGGCVVVPDRAERAIAA